MKNVNHRNKTSRLARVLIGVSIVLTTALFFVAVEIDDLLRENHLNEVRADSTVNLIEVREHIEESIFGHFLLLQKVTTYVEENPDVTQKEFSAYISTLDYLPDEVINFATARDLVVDMVYPVEGNESVLGFDYRSNPDQRPGIERSIENRRATVVGPIDLVQGGKGFIFRQPAFVNDPSSETGKRLWGIVSIVAEHDAFLDVTGLNELSDEFDMLITTDPQYAGRERVVLGNPEIATRNPINLDLEFPTGHWEVAAIPAGGWPTNSPTYVKDRILLGFGSAVIIGLVLLVATLAVLQRRAQVRLTEAIEAMDGGFAMFDHKGRLVAFNAKYMEMYAVSSERIREGARFEDIIRLGVQNGQHPDAIGREEKWIHKRLESFFGPDTEFEQELSNGRYLLASDRALSDGGRLCVRTDVTQLKQAVDQAEAASRAKSEFIDTLSHELRTPITVILGLSSLGKNFETLGMTKTLREKLDDPEVEIDEIKDAVSVLVKHFTDTMEKQERSAKHLHGLVEDMIDFAKIESRKLAVRPETVDIVDLVSSVTDQIRIKAEEKGLAFKVEAEKGEVFCDQLRTTQILLNLVGNAIKFTETGGIEMKAWREGDSAIFEVSDSGPGIPTADQKRIFNAFEQLESSNVRRHSGIGLGLAISRTLADAQNGSLHVDSEPGKGSTFTLRLPSNERHGSARDYGAHANRLDSAA